MAITDEVIQKCMDGDRRAQNALYQYCYRLLISVCWRYASSKEEAIEYMNLSFLKILTHLGRLSRDVPFDAWCRRIAINTMIDEFRKSAHYSRHYQATEETQLSQVAEENVSEWQSDLVDLVMAKIRLLPPMTARVFNLYAIDGYKHHEIAEQLQISEGTSMWHYSEARRRIREMMGVTEKKHA